MEFEQQSDQITFLIATDVHLGHHQKHDILGDDSFQAFSQVLAIAKAKKVDFLLLGGDLFDQVNPSQQTLYRCLSLLRQNIFGDSNIHLNVKGIQPNFCDPNFNISLPIFTIHGNHDYPSNDFGRVSVCDLLHTSKFVNYFGKQQNMNKITIKPLIFRKTKENCRTRLAIYGLGYIKDMKLQQLFNDGLVDFQEPPGGHEEYFCLFILHQNRYKGHQPGAQMSNCIFPRYFPQWINIIIWGHQHQSKQDIQKVQGHNLYQPGSTVITSYIQAESLMKQALLLTVKKEEFGIQRQMLVKSYRPLYVLQYSIDQIKSAQGESVDFQKYFDNIISQTLLESANKLKSLNVSHKQPIIRIKINNTGHEMIRLKKLELKYNLQVANPEKIFQFWTKKVEHHRPSLKLQDDLQVLNRIRNKVTLREPHTQMSTRILDAYQKLSNDKFYNEQKKSMIKKQTESGVKLGNYLLNNVRSSKTRMMKQIQVDKIDEKYLNSLNTKLKFIHLNSHQELPHTLTAQELKAIQKLEEQSIDKKIIQSLVKIEESKSKQSQPRQSQRHSILKKKQNQKQKVQKSVHISSDDEDCCQKASKTEYMEGPTINNFKNAKLMIGSVTKDGLKNDKSKKKSTKNVKFDFF